MLLLDFGLLMLYSLILGALGFSWTALVVGFAGLWHRLLFLW